MGSRQFNDGMEIVLEDFNAIAKAIFRDVYDRAFYEFLQRNENSFFGDSFQVVYSNANTVTCKKGLGFQTDLTAVSPEPKRKPLALNTDKTLTITTPHPTNNRIDLVCVKAQEADELTATRNYKSAVDDTVTAQSFVVQRDWSADVILVDGTPAGSPVAPAVPAGYLKIASILVAAVTGIAGSGSVTDSRSLFPIGGDITMNSTSFVRLTAGAAVPFSTLFADADALLKFAHNYYIDLDQLDTSLTISEPASPSANRQRLFHRDGVLYLKNSAGVKTPVGSGGGGGALKWNAPDGDGPIEQEEIGNRIFLFTQGEVQRLVTFVKVPEGFVAGRKISMKLGLYSPSATNKIKFQALTTLIRKNQDALTSVANQNTADSGDLTNTLANKYQLVTIDLTSSVGAINSVQVQPGDMIKIELSRIAPSTSEDTADVRFVPGSTEIAFG